jgi:hypothetical protein
MGVVWAFRIAIALAPGGEALLRYIQTHDPSGPLTIGRDLWDRLRTSTESDATLSTALSDSVGYSANVTTFSGTFEVRRMQALFDFESGAVGGEDKRIITFHLIKATGGTPSADWLAADFTAAKARFDAFWTAIADRYAPTAHYKGARFYKAGPAISPPQLPVHSYDTEIAGTATGAMAMSPQTALTVMERNAGLRKNHGRFYLPPPAATQTNAYGRPTDLFIADVADAANVMYDGWLTDGIPAVIYLPSLPERSPTASDPRYKTKGTFPARAATARTVDEIVVDNIFDVIRSRRHNAATNRQARTIP